MLKPFAAGLVTFLALDLVWIGLVANRFYKQELAGIARMDGDNFAIRLGPVLVLYPLIILGLQLFVLPRAAAGQPWSAALWGGLFGFIGYGVYDLTNYATLTQVLAAHDGGRHVLGLRALGRDRGGNGGREQPRGALRSARTSHRLSRPG